MKRSTRRHLRQGALVAVPLLALGGAWWATRSDTTAVPTPPAAPVSSAKPAAGRVSPGGGVYEHPAPETSATPASAAPCPGCDIVVITVCSLRRDYVSAYGVHDGLTPHIDSIAEGGWRFDDAWAASNFTLASLTAILTGRFGSTTGVLTWDKGLTKDVPTLPEILGFYGYRTGAFTIDAPSGFRPDYGLDRGFQHMAIQLPPRDTPDGRRGPGKAGPGGDSARPVAEWILAQPTDRPMFAMYHNRTAHFPFVLADDTTDPTGIAHALWDAGAGSSTKGPMPGTAGGTAQQGVVSIAGPDPLQVLVQQVGEPAVASWRARYAEAVTRMDVDIGVVLDAVAKRGRPTVVLLVADHGESLDEHGELLHGDAYFDGVVHVPMVLKIPGLPGSSTAVAALVSQVDLAPTLLSTVGAVPPAGIDGASLLPLLRGETVKVRDVTLVEGGVRFVQPGGGNAPRGAVIAPPWALLRQDRGCGGGPEPQRAPGEPGTCLYDLTTDPGEEHNLALEHPDVVKDLLGRWDSFRAAHAQDAASLDLSPEAVDALHRNGYDFRPEPPKPDPAKDPAHE